MALNYARGLPMGDNQFPIIGTVPAVQAIVSRMSENANTSSMIGLGVNTTAIEIATGGTAAAFRWVTAANAGNSVAATSVIAVVSSPNFDHVVPANTMRRFVVPIEVIGTQAEAYGSFVGANVANGLFQWVAWRTLGIASVFMTEYGKNNSY